MKIVKGAQYQINYVEDPVYTHYVGPATATGCTQEIDGLCYGFDIILEDGSRENGWFPEESIGRQIE